MPKRYTNRERKAFAQFAADGGSVVAAAEKAGVAVSTVQNWMRKFQPKPQVQPIPELQQLVDLARSQPDMHDNIMSDLTVESEQLLADLELAYDNSDTDRFKELDAKLTQVLDAMDKISPETAMPQSYSDFS